MLCCSPRHALAISLVLFLASSAGVHREFNGTYTIVNQASGRRIVMNMRGFSASKQWPLMEEHTWNFVPQGNLSYTIVNKKNNMRVLAQSGMDLDQGFFVIDNGPVYEDQKWLLELQSDGSYVIVNVRSKRRMFALSSEQDRSVSFGAIYSSGTIRKEEKWYIVDQEKDESGKWLLKLGVETNKNERLGEHFKAKVGEVLSLKSELKSNHVKLSQELADAKREEAKLADRIQLEKVVNKKLAEHLVASKNETRNVRSELEVQSNARQGLAKQRDEARGQLEIVRLNAEQDESSRKILMQQLDDKKDILGCIWSIPYTQDPVAHTCGIGFLTAAVIIISLVLPYLKHRLTSAHSEAATLAAELAAVQESETSLVEDSAKKDSRIAELEHSTDSLEPWVEQSGPLGFDFASQVFNIDSDQSTMRLIKIQCPGVAHEDIEVQLIFNGCEVIISRKASPGVEATTWRKQFYWKPSQGLFEFKEDQMQLERGFLHLVFKAYNFQSRAIRFPQHFTLDATDNDLCWDFDEGEDLQPDEFELFEKRCAHIEAKSQLDTESTASTPQKGSCRGDN